MYQPQGNGEAGRSARRPRRERQARTSAPNRTPEGDKELEELRKQYKKMNLAYQELKDAIRAPQPNSGQAPAPVQYQQQNRQWSGNRFPSLSSQLDPQSLPFFVSGDPSRPPVGQGTSRRCFNCAREEHFIKECPFPRRERVLFRRPAGPPPEHSQGVLLASARAVAQPGIRRQEGFSRPKFGKQVEEQRDGVLFASDCGWQNSRMSVRLRE